MAKNTTKIEWASIFGFPGITWNPFIAFYTDKYGNRLRGHACVRFSSACTRCYAETRNKNRPWDIGTGLPYDLPSINKVEFEISREGTSSMDFPLKTKTSHGIFPVSMSDWQLEHYPAEFAMEMMSVMRQAPQHVFITLTKRYRALSDFLDFEESQNGRLPKNILYGITLASQKDLDEAQPTMIKMKRRHPHLSFFISSEPTLGYINWNGIQEWADWMIGGFESDDLRHDVNALPARPGNPDWARTTRDFCLLHGIPFFWKQNGEYIHASQVQYLEGQARALIGEAPIIQSSEFGTVYRIGKFSTGDLIDGKAWKQFPRKENYVLSEVKKTSKYETADKNARSQPSLF